MRMHVHLRMHSPMRPRLLGVRRAMRGAGFAPTFEVAARQQPLPATTCWNGALVDYIYTNANAKNTNAPRYALVEATYPYYTLSSDHLPLVSDLVVSV